MSRGTRDRCDAIRVSADRLWRSLQELAEIGAQSGGGVTRVALTAEELAARQYVIAQLAPLGFETRVDSCGNLFARRPGREKGLAPLWVGSHLDTVVNGGRFDGALGVLAAVEMVRALDDHDVLLCHPLEIISFCDEEGGLFSPTFGSRGIVGMLTDRERERAVSPEFRERLLAAGGDPDRIHNARRHPGEVTAYVELHVEQGSVLHDAGVSIGIVEAIVGTTRHQIRCLGVSNHAGTTPMMARDDALVRAAEFILTVRQVALSVGYGAVSTVGTLRVQPGVVNVIPGEVTLSVDARAMRTDLLDEIDRRLRAFAEEFSGIDFLSTFRKSPVPCSERVIAAAANACDALGLSYRTMASGAGHDVSPIATLCDAGMVFVPSWGGLSHCPDEYTSPAACAEGADVLLHTVLNLDELSAEAPVA